MRTIIFASNNQHKLKEVRRIFEDYEILSLQDIGFTDDIVEDGDTFQANARIKAEAVMQYNRDSGLDLYPVVADDSGLCVRALNNEPGVYSARYSGKGDEGNRQLLLEKLKNINDRKAYFQCCAYFLLPDGRTFVADGKTHGSITREKLGDDSFGFDCLFWSDPLEKTFGQATPEEKDSVSHRAVAMQKVREYLDNLQ